MRSNEKVLVQLFLVNAKVPYQALTLVDMIPSGKPFAHCE